jgi:alcohol dehydrogenase class IV/protocatechuate 3,4-dioxygenase beta subunit
VTAVPSFTYRGNPGRVVFRPGALADLPAEVARLGCARALLLVTPSQAAAGARAEELLGAVAAGRFDRVAMHTPVEVTDEAAKHLERHAADCLVAIGGGSAVGLGKALAVRSGLPLVAVPTTYAGSEVTPVVGETANGVKTVRSVPEAQPRTVLYDVELTLGLPVPITVTSGVNAMAHAVEALYSPEANPVTDGHAVEAIGRLSSALPRIAADPGDLPARTDAQIGAWLAGLCLGAVPMGLHHRLCHVLGGSFGLPHAETHTVLLPHVLASAPDALDRVAEAMNVPEAATGLHDLVASLGGPLSLASLGLAESDLPRAAEAAGSGPALDILTAAWRGDRPAAGSGLGSLTEQVVRSFAGAPDRRTGRLLGDLVRHLHRYARRNDLTEAEWQYAIDFLTRTGQLCGPTRQEFILLSDTLGVSSVVDALTNSRTPDTTPSAVLGPFYVEGPPVLAAGSDLAAGLPGTPLWVDVRITDTGGRALPGAVVDVWQSNDDGFYDVQLPDLEGPVLRGRLHSDAEGRVRFWSILPSEYPIPDDGPVGQMLRSVGRHPYRAPHLHFIIMAPGHRRLVTQLFVAGGAYLDSDTVFGVKPELVVDFEPRSGPAPDGRVVGGEWRALTFTFQVAPG